MRRTSKSVGWSLLAGVLGVALAAGCGPDEQSVTVGTSESKGSVGGIVLSAAPGLPPLVGASVTVVAGGSTFTTTTDENGTFSVREVPSGSVIVRVTAADRIDVYVTGTLPSSAGNFPVSNASLTVGPIAMLGSKGTFTVRIVDEQGAPRGGVKVNARINAAWLDLAGGGASERGVVSASATSEPNGIATLGGLPEFGAVGAFVTQQLTVNVPPMKIMGVESYEFLGLTTNYSPLAIGSGSFAGQTPTIVLSGPRTALDVISSNVDFLVSKNVGPVGSIVSEAGPINIVFNQGVSQQTFAAVITTETGDVAPIMTNSMVSGNVASITFQKPLKGATRYNVQIHATTLYKPQPRELNLKAPFFTSLPSGGPTISTQESMLDPLMTDDFLIKFNEPVGLGNGNAARIECVVFFETQLDNSNLAPGQWTSSGNGALKCGTLDGTYLYPVEATSGPRTGFTSVYRLQYRKACNLMGGCQFAQKNVHLVFSRTPNLSQIMKRVDGTPVPDLVVTLPPGI